MNQSPHILLDTCVISHFTYKNPSEHLITWLRTFPEDSLAISVATVVEIQKGIENLRAAKSPRVQAFETWLDELLTTDINCIPQCTKVARLQGRMISVPALKNLWVPDPNAKSPKYGQDLLIAATSICHNIPIATLNIKDFEAIHEHFSLPGLIDPSTSVWHISPPWPPQSLSNDRSNVLT